MRGPLGPSGQRTWPGIMEREAGDPWGVRGQVSPLIRRAHAAQRGEWLSGVDPQERTMSGHAHEWAAEGDDDLLSAELEDDVVGSGIFDAPGRKPTANSDMGVLASRFGLPGYLARERPFEVSEDIIAASGAQFVPVPSGGMSYVSPASVGPNMFPDYGDVAPGIRRTYRRSTSLPKASIVEPLGEDAVPLRPVRAKMGSTYYVPGKGNTGLVTTREGQTELTQARQTVQQRINKGRQVAARVRQEMVRRGVPFAPHPWFAKDNEPDDHQVDVPHDELYPQTEDSISGVSFGGRPGKFLIRPGQRPISLSGEGDASSTEQPMGLGGWLVTGLVLGIAGSILYQTIK